MLIIKGNRGTHAARQPLAFDLGRPDHVGRPVALLHSIHANLIQPFKAKTARMVFICHSIVQCDLLAPFLGSQASFLDRKGRLLRVWQKLLDSSSNPRAKRYLHRP